MPNPAVDGTPGRRAGSVSLCALGCACSRTRGMMSVSAPSSASLDANFVLPSAWNAPSFIAAELLLGGSGQVFRAKSCIFGFSWKPGHTVSDCNWEFITSLPGRANSTGIPSAKKPEKVD